MSSEDQKATESKSCPFCGEQIKAIAKKCRHCHAYLDETLRAENRASLQASSTDRMLMPVDRPMSAIAAGYLGLFSLLPGFGILAIAASVYAFSVLNKNPELSGRGRAYFGLGMGLVCTLLYGVMIVAAAHGY